MARSGVINAMTKDELDKVLHVTPQKSDDTAAAQTIAIPAFVTANLSADSVSTSACDPLAVTASWAACLMRRCDVLQRPYRGHGGLSAGASSRLLMDYRDPQRSEILDVLFKPGYGASVDMLKSEIGASHDHTAARSFARKVPVNNLVSLR